MAAMTATTANKRRRISLPTVLKAPQNIRDLDVGPLSHVASFLPAPSRAMFAAALCDWSPGFQSIFWIDRPLANISLSVEKIVGECDNLDFGDIEEELAQRLTDDHISDILICLNRDDYRIKKLRLTNCINVTGECLCRLYYSENIEQIDLRLAPKHMDSCRGCKGRLEFPVVVEVLDSIISLQQRSSLKCLHLPWSWRYCPVKPKIDQFMIRYERLWENRVTVCARCTYEFTPKICGGATRTVVMQLNTCSICLKDYCSECIGEDGKEFITFCELCEGVHCQDCIKMERCGSCYEGFCLDHCGGSEVWKKNHRQHNYEECSGCDKKICGRCCFGRTCSKCNEIDCGMCRSFQVPIRRGLDFEYYHYCKHVEECEICNLTWCRSCKDWKEGGDCDRPVICEECVPERTCHSCDKSFCNRCRSIAECQGCHKNWCSDCDPQRAWGRDSRGGYCIDCAET